MTRLPEQAGEVIDRSAPISITWQGERMPGFAGDTIQSVLAANDVTILSRSMKYHRPRGIMTADYWDPGSMVQVNDEPNVRAGHRLAANGQTVTPQNVWPSLERDVKAANQLVGKFLTAGFYYKTFIRPARLAKTYQRVLSTFAPGGNVDLSKPAGTYDKRVAHPDVVVAGGGPAGMAAAIAAAKAGADVLLVEHNHRLGGHLLWGSDADRARAAELAAAVEAAGVEVYTDATVTGVYEDNWCAINVRSDANFTERLIKARAKTLVVSPGLIERPYVFKGNDMPGVMLSGAVRRLINLYAVKPGSRAVVFTANDDGDATVSELERVGVHVAKVVDARTGGNITKVEGSTRHMEKVILGDGSEVEADLLAVAAGWTAPTSLLNMAGCRPEYNPAAARFFPGPLVDNVLATGGIAGDGSLDELVAHGTSTGELAAKRALVMRHKVQAATVWADDVAGAGPEMPTDTRTDLGHDPHPELFRSSTHGIIDFSEDIGSKDILGAAAEGYDSIELVKRYTTVTMGQQQGKLETVNAVAVMAEARNETIAEVGTTVWRPPFAPVSLGALAGRNYEAYRVSSIQPWHEANGVTNLIAGQWYRPDHYGNPSAEVRRVRNDVGIIDVTPLGKLDLRGPDVPKLLNLVYTNKWSKLGIGKVRYGVMCADDGVVMDDGVTARLGEDHYLMTTTSGGAARIWNWIENWLQTERPDWQVHVTPVTTALCSINIAGPKSRELLSRFTDVDLSPEAFPYMEVRQGTIADVDNCIMWRIGFTGELSYEIHVPAGYGMHVWTQLLANGEDLNVGPFGIEAQRIMRLEKGHFIVGQDTDGLSLMHTTGLEPLIKLDKDDFVGKAELAWADGDKLPKLVAIQPTNPNLVPPEASQIVRAHTNEIVGRITSSRFSPTLNRSICLGQVEPQYAAAGTELTVVVADTDNERTTAKVMEHHAHYDPEGERLRV